MKVHLFISARPMRNGETVAAKCGDLIERAQIVHAWDEVIVNAKLDIPSTLGVCVKCLKAIKGRGRNEREFCYAISKRGNSDE